jgi:hypothetical protein
VGDASEANGQRHGVDGDARAFLLVAVISLAIAYPFYASATEAPDINSDGFVLVLTDDSSVSLKVELAYARYVKESKDSSRVTLEEWGEPNVGGDDQITSLVLRLSRTGDSDSRPHRYLAIFGGDARLRDVALYEPIKTHSVDQAQVASQTLISESDIQTFEGTIPDKPKSVLSGDLTWPVMDTAVGKTFVRIPSLGSARDSPRGGVRYQ